MKRLVEFLINSKSTGIIKTKNDEFVDLGLDVLWAKCNIGAKEETDYGHYFMFASTTPNDNDNCNWINTPYCKSYSQVWSNESWDKYDNSDRLELDDDAAYVMLGKNYKIPTQNNFNELLTKIHKEWKINYNNSGINGGLFTAENGNSIFFPATGMRIGQKVCGEGKSGSLWTNTISGTHIAHAYSLSFDEKRIVRCFYERCNGIQIRAIKEKS